MNIQPLSDRVLVKKVQPEEKTQSGIFIGDMQNNKQVQTAIVVAAGPGKDKIPMQVKIGDTVLFAKYAGVETHEDHLMIREDEIFGIVSNNHIGSSFEDFLKESGISPEEITELALQKIKDINEYRDSNKAE